jgi:guanine deaminase
MKRVAIRGDLLDVPADPGWGATESAAVRFDADHWLLIDEAGRIVGRSAQEPDASWEKHDHRGRLVTPGFIDTHVHSPQLDVIASYGTELLDWLNTHTFPAEQRYADAGVAAEGAARFVDALFAHGTTAAAPRRRWCSRRCTRRRPMHSSAPPPSAACGSLPASA